MVRATDRFAIAGSQCVRRGLGNACSTKFNASRTNERRWQIVTDADADKIFKADEAKVCAGQPLSSEIGATTQPRSGNR